MSASAATYHCDGSEPPWLSPGIGSVVINPPPGPPGKGAPGESMITGGPAGSGADDVDPTGGMVIVGPGMGVATDPGVGTGRVAGVAESVFGISLGKSKAARFTSGAWARIVAAG